MLRRFLFAARTRTNALTFDNLIVVDLPIALNDILSDHLVNFSQHSTVVSIFSLSCIDDAYGDGTEQIPQLISATHLSSFVCPVVVCRHGLPTVATVHESPYLVSFVTRDEVIILNTCALEQQHSHQITRSPFNQYVLLVTVDVCRVFNADGVSTPRVSSHSVQRLSKSVPPCLWSCMFVLLRKSILVHASILPFVLNQFSISSANFSMLILCTQIVDSECDWIPPKHELTTHGFSVSSDAVMFRRLCK